jgi:MFS family permease
MTPLSPTDLYQREVLRHFRRNFVFNALDISAFMFGLSLVSATTVLPLYARHLTSSLLLIGLIPTITNVGWAFPQLFVANAVTRLRRKKPLVIGGTVIERMPFLLLALTIIIWPQAPSDAALVLFLALLTIHAISGGLAGVAWQDFIAKLIPVERRGFFFGVSYSMAGLLGLVGAFVSQAVLGYYLYPFNFAVCMFLAFSVLAVGFFSLVLTHEPAQPDIPRPMSTAEFWRRLPSVLQGDSNFSKYLLSRTVTILGTMATGFVAVYAASRFNLPDQVAGWFTAAMMVSQVIGNPFLGLLGDRLGHKLVLELTAAATAMGMGIILLASSEIWIYLVFALIGISMAGGFSSSTAIVFEFCPPDHRPIYIGLSNTLLALPLAIASLLGGLLAQALGYQGLFAISLVLSLLGGGMLLWLVREPRAAAHPQPVTSIS